MSRSSLLAIGLALILAVPLAAQTRLLRQPPVSDQEIAVVIQEIYDLRPAAIEKHLKLRNPIYQETAAYGHMGKEPRIVKKTFTSQYWEPIELEVELFTWEKLDRVDDIKNTFGL